MKEVIAKLKEHDKNFLSIDRKLKEHDKKFDSIDKRFGGIDAKLKKHDEQFDRLIALVLKHDERLDRIEETMATKKDVRDIMDTLDYVVKITLDTQQEMVMLTHAMRRHEDRIEHLERI